MASRAADYVTAAGALIGGGGGLIAGIAAWRALHTWRAKLTGEARFDVAKRLLTAAHDLAGKFHDARSRGVQEPELTAVLLNPNASAGQKAGQYMMAFDARWEPVRACGAHMLALLPETKALLLPAVAKAAEALLESTYRLRASMDEFVSYVRDFGMGGQDADESQQVRSQWLRVRKDVYSSDPRRSPESDNPLTQEFVERHEDLVNALKGYVQRRGG